MNRYKTWNKGIIKLYIFWEFITKLNKNIKENFTAAKINFELFKDIGKGIF